LFCILNWNEIYRSFRMKRNRIDNLGMQWKEKTAPCSKPFFKQITYMIL
jgi:hypothetical protein